MEPHRNPYLPYFAVSRGALWLPELSRPHEISTPARNPGRTVWRLDRRRARLLREWFEGWTDAALEQEPALAAVATGYRERRASQLESGQLSVHIRHLDLLAWPRA